MNTNEVEILGEFWVKMHVLDPGVDTKHSHGIRRHQMSAYGGLIFVGRRFISTSARFYEPVLVSLHIARDGIILSNGR